MGNSKLTLTGKVNRKPVTFLSIIGTRLDKREREFIKHGNRTVSLEKNRQDLEAFRKRVAEGNASPRVRTGPKHNEKAKRKLWADQSAARAERRAKTLDDLLV